MLVEVTACRLCRLDVDWLAAGGQDRFAHGAATGVIIIITSAFVHGVVRGIACVCDCGERAGHHAQDQIDPSLDWREVHPHSTAQHIAHTKTSLFLPLAQVLLVILQPVYVPYIVLWSLNLTILVLLVLKIHCVILSSSSSVVCCTNSACLARFLSASVRAMPELRSTRKTEISLRHNVVFDAAAIYDMYQRL